MLEDVWSSSMRYNYEILLQYSKFDWRKNIRARWRGRNWSTQVWSWIKTVICHLNVTFLNWTSTYISIPKLSLHRTCCWLNKDHELVSKLNTNLLKHFFTFWVLLFSFCPMALVNHSLKFKCKVILFFQNTNLVRYCKTYLAKVSGG